MQVTIPLAEAKVLLAERVIILNEMIPALEEKLQDDKERYIEIKAASAWWHRQPEYWAGVWENGEPGEGIWGRPAKEWNKNLLRIKVIQETVAKMNKLISKFDLMELDGVTEAVLGDYEIGLVWYKDAIK